LKYILPKVAYFYVTNSVLVLKLVYFYVSKAFYSQTYLFGIKKGRFRLKNDLKMKKTPKKLDVFSLAPPAGLEPATS